MDGKGLLAIVCIVLLGVVGYGAVSAMDVAISSNVGISGVAHGLQLCINGATGTGIYQDAAGKYLLFLWQQGNGYAITSFHIGQAGNAVWGELPAMKLGAESAASYIQKLTADGWVRLLPQDLWPAVMSSVQAVISQAASRAVSMPFVPVLLVSPEDLTGSPFEEVRQ